jgi:hypothetical protein
MTRRILCCVARAANKSASESASVCSPIKCVTHDSLCLVVCRSAIKCLKTPLSRVLLELRNVYNVRSVRLTRYQTIPQTVNFSCTPTAPEARFSRCRVLHRRASPTRCCPPTPPLPNPRLRTVPGRSPRVSQKMLVGIQESRRAEAKAPWNRTTGRKT